jgi:hypothetical protein
MVSGEGLSAFKGTPVEQVWSHALVPHPRLTPRGKPGHCSLAFKAGYTTALAK